MNIYVTGDCHGNFKKFSMKNFPVQKDLTKEDVVIVCGDFGGVWDYRGENNHERYWLDWLNDKSFTTVFVDGNHENFTRLASYPMGQWNGAACHIIRPSVLHIMRGEVAILNNKKFFFFGGAASHDIQDGIIPYSKDWKKDMKNWERSGRRMYRIEEISWWATELPSEQEMIAGATKIPIYKDFDYVITHEMPASALMFYGKGFYQPDEFSQYLDQFLPYVNKQWYCGHYHDDIKINSFLTCLYNNIIEIGE